MGKICVLLAAATITIGAAMPGSALAHGARIAPPGNSGVSQYQEDVPTAGGEVPSNSLGSPSASHGRPAPGGQTGGGNAAGSAGSSKARSSKASSSLARLRAMGSEGSHAAQLAEATAPQHGAATAPSTASKAAGAGAGAALASAAAGSGEGLGLLLPILLGAVALSVIVALALRRRMQR